jgi:uncharacterized protein (UPF0147 family)
MNQEFEDIILTLNVIKGDDSVPRNIRSKIDYAINCLNNKGKETCLKVDEILQELDDISNDPNLPNYTRIEVLNIIGMLGKL